MCQFAVLSPDSGITVPSQVCCLFISRLSDKMTRHQTKDDPIPPPLIFWDSFAFNWLCRTTKLTHHSHITHMGVGVGVGCLLWGGCCHLGKLLHWDQDGSHLQRPSLQWHKRVKDGFWLVSCPTRNIHIWLHRKCRTFENSTELNTACMFRTCCGGNTQFSSPRLQPLTHR